MREDEEPEWLRRIEDEHAQDDIELAEMNARRERERRERLERKLADPTLSRAEKREAIQNERDLQRFSKDLDAAVNEFLGRDRRDDDMPPLITTDDVRYGAIDADVVERDVDESKPQRMTRAEIRAQVQAEQATREPDMLDRLERWSAERDGEDDDPVVRYPRRPGAASRSLHAVPALAKGFLIGAVVCGLLWLLACWGLSSLFGWYMWGTGLMVTTGVVFGLCLLSWCAMAWDDVSQYVRSGGRRPFHRYY